MKEEIFRKKSIDRIKSPENLDDYICVSSPGVWLLLISILMLLAGACVWGIFGVIDSTVYTSIAVKDGIVQCYVAEENISAVRVGQTVRVEDKEVTISGIGERDEKGYTCTLSTNPGLSEGYYDGQIVVESYKPMSFILN